MGIGDYLALLITILFPLAGLYLLIRCWNHIFFRRDKNSVYFQKKTSLLLTAFFLEVVSIVVVIIWNNSSYYANRYITLFVIDVFFWIIGITLSLYWLKTGKDLDKALPEIPDAPLADDELEYYREAFTGLFEDIRTSNANRKAELEKKLLQEEGKRKKTKAIVRIAGKATRNVLANSLLTAFAGIEPAYLDNNVNLSTIDSAIARLLYAMKEIDTAAEKTLKKLQSDDPAETRMAILQLLAAYDDIMEKNREIRFDQPCYGLETADIMYRFLRTLSPFAYDKIYGLYNDYTLCIGIRVNIRDNLVRIVKKGRETETNGSQ